MFSIDNPFWSAIGKFCDFIILNLLFVVCCIPIVTIGASSAALYTVTRKMINDEGSSAAKEFFKAFRSNFKQATIIWLILLPIGLLTLYEMYLITLIEFAAAEIMKYVFLALLIVWCMVVSWAFPMQSKFDNSVKNTLKNTLLLSGYHLLPWTVVITLLNIFPWVLIFTFPGFAFILVQLMGWIGFSAIAGLNTLMFEKLFQQHIDAREDM